MDRRMGTPIVQRLAVAAVLLAVLGGCRWPWAPPGKPYEIPAGAVPRPAGTHVCEWVLAHRLRAEEDALVIYQYEWLADRAELGPFGVAHVGRIAERLAEVPYPIVVEPSDEPALDEARRQVVLERLAAAGVVVPPERVVLGHGRAEGLYGEEAPAVYDGALDATVRLPRGITFQRFR